MSQAPNHDTNTTAQTLTTHMTADTPHTFYKHKQKIYYN